MRGVEKLVPELRFPGSDNQWSSKRFNDVLILKSRPFKMDDESEYSLVTVKRRYGGVIARGIYKGQEIKVKSQFKLKENDFIISKRQIVHNACGIVPKNLSGSIVSNEYSVFKPKSNLDIAYFNYFCHLPKISHTFYLSSIGVHIEKMLFKVDDWLKWQFCFPALPEQQKIASFLSAVDKKIEKLIRKKELLETYKKGVMQKIFSRKIRFKDENGKDYPEWEEVQLGEIANFHKGKGLSKAEIETDGKIKCIRYGELYTHYSEVISEIKSATNAEISRLFLSKRNDVMIPSSGETSIDIATASCLDMDDVAVGGDINVIRTRQHGIFLSYYLNNAKKIDIAKLAQGISVIHLYSKHLKILKILLPSLKEQTKIANVLSTTDKKIKTVQTQLTQTQKFKKGLLQKMFV